MFVIRKKLSETEGVSQTQRWNQDEEVFQTTFDGGTTWVDTPSSDPRYSEDLINPATDDRCNAAQGFSNFVRQFVDSTYEAFNVVGISSAAISIGLLWVPGINLFFKIAQIVADGVVAIGATTLAATFTEDVYDDIKNIAYCHIDATGHFTEDAWNDIGADLQTFIGGSAFNITMALMYNLYGWVGFQNGALGLAEDATCTGEFCGCSGTSVNFGTSNNGFVTDAWDIFAAIGTYTTDIFGTGWYAGSTGSANQIGISGTVETVCGTGIEMNVNRAVAPPTAPTVKVRITTATQTKTATWTPSTGSNTAFWNEGGFLEEAEGFVEIGYDGESGYGFMIGSFQTGNI